MIFEQKCFENTLKPKKNHYILKLPALTQST